MPPNLPNPEVARNLSFQSLATKIRDFLVWYDEKQQRVPEKDLTELLEMVDLLKNYGSSNEDQLGPCPPSPPSPPQKLRIKGFSKSLMKQRKILDKQYQNDYDNWLSHHKNNWLAWQKNKEILQQNSRDERRIYEGRKSDIEELIKRGGWPKIIELNWYILPPGYWPKTLQDVEHLLPNKSNKGYCPERIVHAQSLEPFEIGRGKGDFDRYFCFRYRFTNKVLLESADDGNAAYILNGDWRALSRRTKNELINKYPNEITRIHHRLDSPWRVNITNILKDKI